MTINTTPEVKDISPKDTAKFVRKAVKTSFPDTRFSIKTRVYTGGSSISVSWTDGPRTQAVEKIAKQFEGADFDGMVDLKTYNRHWLLPDGTVEIAHSPAMTYTNEIVTDAPHPDAIMINFRADYIFCNRHESDFYGLVVEAEKMIRAKCVSSGETPNERFGNDWLEDLARRMARDKGGDEEMEAAFKRVVLRE